MVKVMHISTANGSQTVEDRTINASKWYIRSRILAFNRYIYIYIYIYIYRHKIMLQIKEQCN